jgi:hypothetical protein
MELQPDEVFLEGKWEEKDGSVKKDTTAIRIEWLINHWLKKLATSDGGWTVLYQDSTDQRFWELTFPHSAWHGGGPPALRCLSPQEAKSKFGTRIII